MKWVVRLAAACAIALILYAVLFRHDYVPRFAGFILLILFGVGIYEKIDMTRFFGNDDNDNDGGPMRPA